MLSRFPLASDRTKALTWSLLLFTAVALLGLLAWGLHNTYQDRMQRSHHQAERELMAIGHLQAEGVAAWREQRMADAFALSDDGLLALAAADWLETKSPKHARLVQQRLRILQERAKYVAVFLVDTKGQVQLNPQGDAQLKLPVPEQRALEDAVSQAHAVSVDPRLDQIFAFPFFSVMAPLFKGVQPVGAVWLVSDVRSTLFPLLGLWPTPSETAESSIVTRQGDSVVYLSPLRQTAGETIQSHRLLASSRDPAVQALLGARGIFHAQDYRSQDVIAMASAVPDSPWVLVTKIDEEEVLAGTRERELLALGSPVILGLLLIGVLFILWQRNAWRRERALKIDLQRHMRWLEGAQKVASIGYFALDMVQGKFTLSDMARDIVGVHQQNPMKTKEWMVLIDAQDRATVQARYEQALSQRTPVRIQYRIQRGHDHQRRWIEVWGDFEVSFSNDRVDRLIGTLQDITERKQTEEELANYRSALEEKVRLDPLTQLGNRRALDEHMSTEWQRATRTQAPLSFLMIDVDHFKAFNDLYGHVGGDQCLRRVAKAIASSVGRAGELAARYGGEEFAVLLPDADLAHAQGVAERICAAVQSLDMAHESSKVAPHVTVSIGVTCVKPVFADDTSLVPNAVQATIEQADAALYQAKQQGRNRVVAYETPVRQVE